MTKALIKKKNLYFNGLVFSNRCHNESKLDPKILYWLSNFLSLDPLKNLFLRYLSNKRVGYLGYKLFM